MRDIAQKAQDNPRMPIIFQDVSKSCPHEMYGNRGSIQSIAVSTGVVLQPKQIPSVETRNLPHFSQRSEFFPAIESARIE